MFFFLNDGANEEDKQSIIDLFQNDPASTAGGLPIPNVDITDSRINQVSDSQLNDSSDNQGEDKLETKRQKSKFRSRKSRERKKKYIEELETRVKDLEKENIKLQHLLDQYKGQKVESVSEKHKITSETIVSDKSQIVDLFWDKDKKSYKEGANMSVADHFRMLSPKMISNHVNLIDQSFEVILDKMIFLMNRQYWRDLGTEYTTEFEEIKKLHKLTKYQVPEYLKEHNLNAVDKHVSLLDPDKCQFKYLKNVFIPKHIEIKQKMKTAVDYLMKARDIVLETLHYVYIVRGAKIKSGIFEDSQIVNANIREMTVPASQVSTQELWNLDKETKKFEVDLTKDEILGKWAKKWLRADDQKCSFEIDSYKRKDS